MRVKIEVDSNGVVPELKETGTCYEKIFEDCQILGLQKGDDIWTAVNYADGVTITYVSFDATTGTMEYGCYENEFVVDRDFHEALLKSGFKPKKK